MHVDADRAKMTTSSETKAAIKYLVATGATAISILARDGACEIRVGTKIDPHAISVVWLREPNAIAVSRQARREAGERPDAATIMSALRRAAAHWNEMLTPHDLAIERTTDAIRRLDAAMEGLRASGQLSIFNQHYRAARDAAASKDTGFMPYEVALSRLRMALVPHLSGGKGFGDVTELFTDIFGPPEFTD
ncbi:MULTISPECIES: hypothetical protein [unclassified Bradyrhizobium]|uniref:hypothetical protein n=1 Tax=unclassified Bradyrhizobium TaxID=2631580 RepID=UPI00070C6373|nr:MULTISPECIES: hypothetical protein [unclassified Bradyrhizobium]KQT12890.1 hypothetical protein ASG57_08025 [Bradyrhizobium sp. Leaf396]